MKLLGRWHEEVRVVLDSLINDAHGLHLVEPERDEDEAEQIEHAERIREAQMKATAEHRRREES